MKKSIKIMAVIAVFTLICCGCGKKNKESGENTEPNTAITDTAENENNDNENSQAKDNSQAKSEENESTGLFLGMDDSNFAVIFVENKDVHFKIAESLDLVNSPVDIGDSVKFTYSEENGEKTLLTIEKAQ